LLFAHGSGSSRHSPRNQMVAGRLQRVGLSTVLVDLLTAEEEQAEERGAVGRFDIALLAGRLGYPPAATCGWYRTQPTCSPNRRVVRRRWLIAAWGRCGGLAGGRGGGPGLGRRCPGGW